MTAADALLAEAAPLLSWLAGRLAAVAGVEPADARQELALALERAAPGFDPAKGSVRTFTSLVCRRHFRKTFCRRLRLPMADADAEDLDALAYSREPDPADQVELNELADLVLAAVGELPARQRQAVELRYGLGCPPLQPTEVAGVMGIHPGSVSRHLRSGLEAVAVCVGADPAEVAMPQDRPPANGFSAAYGRCKKLGTR